MTYIYNTQTNLDLLCVLLEDTQAQADTQIFLHSFARAHTYTQSYRFETFIASDEKKFEEIQE